MRNMLAQKKLELESMLQDSETRAEEMEETNQTLQAEKTKLQNNILALDEQYVHCTKENVNQLCT